MLASRLDIQTRLFLGDPRPLLPFCPSVEKVKHRNCAAAERAYIFDVFVSEQTRCKSTGRIELRNVHDKGPLKAITKGGMWNEKRNRNGKGKAAGGDAYWRMRCERNHGN